MSIWDFIDFVRDVSAFGKGRRRNPDDISPQELRARSQEAQNNAEMAAMGASMLAYFKQDKKCAKCGQPMVEETAVLRLINSERGMAKDNVILVCPPCNKEISASTPKPGL